MSQLIDSGKLAEMLGVSEGTLRNWRSQKKGPPFIKLGKTSNADVRYEIDEVQRWLKKNSSRR
jgi:predicted DNA-binding transcriptional regulator AlpA